MATQTDEKISRRLGRMDLLLTDLEQLPENYQPVEVELVRVAELVEKIQAAYGLNAPEAIEEAPAPEPVPAKKGK